MLAGAGRERLQDAALRMEHRARASRFTLCAALIWSPTSVTCVTAAP